jgi:type I restriction enzyme, S subunit
LTSLPLGWTNPRLADICDINPRKPSKAVLPDDAEVTFVPMAAVDHVLGAIVDPVVRRAGEVRKGYTSFGEGDVLLAKITPSFENGKAAVATGLVSGYGFGTTEFHVLRPRALVHARYLFHFLRQRRFRQAAAQYMTGTAGQLRVTSDYLQDVEIPLPPPAEQEKIVSMIDAVLETTRRVSDRLSRVKPLLDHLQPAMLTRACNGDLTADWRSEAVTSSMADTLAERASRGSEVRTRRGVPARVQMSEEIEAFDVPVGWSKISVAELLRIGALLDVKDGNHGSNHPKKNEFSAEGVPFITAAQVRNFEIDYENAPHVQGQVLDRLRVGFAKPGDAVLTHKGTVGRAALCTQDCVLTPQTTYYRTDPDIIDPQYLVYLFASGFFFRQLANVMSQTTRDFVPISEQYRLFVVLPPLEEQREIVRRVGSLLQARDAARGALAVASARMGLVIEAVLDRAFAGTLVSSDIGRSARTSSVQTGQQPGLPTARLELAH